MLAEVNKALYRRLADEVMSQGKLELIDELLAPDVIEHEQVPGIEGDGRQVFEQFLELFRGAFPDLRLEVHDLIAEGDKVVGRATMTGTHRGDFMGLPATGKRFSISVIDIVRVKDGRIVEHWGQSDNLGMLQQLGALPDGE